MRATNRHADRTRARIRTVYVLVNLALIAVGGVLGAPIVVLVTLVAVPDLLVFVPTTFVYFNALVAPLLFAKGALSRRVGIAVAVCAAVALLPGGYSRLRVAAIGARLAWNDVVEPVGGKARRIALRYDLDPDQPRFEEELCGRACRELLLSGAVDSIAIATSASPEPPSTTFVVAKGPACARMAVASGEARCVLPRFDDPGPPDLILTARARGQPVGGARCGIEPGLIGGWCVTGSLRQPGGPRRVVYSKEEQRLWPIALPYAVGPHIPRGVDSFAYGSVCADPVRVNPLTLRGMFEDLGYRIRTDIPPEDGPASSP